MRRWLAVAAGVLALTIGATQTQAASGARLTIVAVNPDGTLMEFRTLGLRVTAFNLANGGRRTFNVKAGTYVVVQAPPLAGQLSVDCTGTDDFIEVTLANGDNVTCTYTIERL